MDVQLQVGACEAYRGTPLVLVIEIVGNTVFDTVGDEFGVWEFGTVHSGVDGKCLVRRQILVPFEVSHEIIKFVGV